ncbi:unnamed protein product [Protopolystoma xenopodis]|uniref:Uncharacterized protein n=1 Tax=Protopolystoma xenopodis TaxID=117903 RepID=A0A448XM37_9PLAT|nr:unnamed protein product [Protopolystoma xenopodis]
MEGGSSEAKCLTGVSPGLPTLGAEAVGLDPTSSPTTPCLAPSSTTNSRATLVCPEPSVSTCRSFASADRLHGGEGTSDYKPLFTRRSEGSGLGQRRHDIHCFSVPEFGNDMPRPQDYNLATPDGADRKQCIWFN